jgi:hypothetical protein
MLFLFMLIILSCNPDIVKKGNKNIRHQNNTELQINDVVEIKEEIEDEEFVQYDIYAQWDTPYVEIGYDKRSYLNPSLIIVFHNGEKKVFQLFETGMFYDYLITLDTIRLGKGKYPALIVDWHTDMWHNYGLQAVTNLWGGGWKDVLNGLSIWDLNEQKCLFSSNYYNYSHEDFGENDTNYLRECFWNYKVEIDTLNKIIILDSITQKFIGRCDHGACWDSVDMNMGKYYFEVDTFIRK